MSSNESHQDAVQAIFSASTASENGALQLRRWLHGHDHSSLPDTGTLRDLIEADHTAALARQRFELDATVLRRLADTEVELARARAEIVSLKAQMILAS